MILQATIKKPNGEKIVGQRGSDNKILIMTVRSMAFLIVALLGWLGTQVWATQVNNSERLGVVEKDLSGIKKGVESNGKILDKLLDIQLNGNR